MEIREFVQIINKLYDERDKHNTDVWHVGGFFYRLTDSSPADVKDAFSTYAKRSRASKKILDEIVTLQKKYRTLFGWDENVSHMIGALGYLGQKSIKFADYLFERITSTNEDDRYSISEKYFLTFCLTTAARVDLYSTGLLWKLHWCSWATNWIWDSRSVDENEIEEEFIRLDSNVHEALRDSMRVFDVAALEVISFLISKLGNNYYGTPPMVWGLLYQVLGETPIVKCLRINEENDYTYTTVNFSDQVLTLFRNPRNLSNIEKLFSEWCRNDEKFRLETLRAIDSIETDISYLSHFLIMKLKKVRLSVKEKLAFMSENEKHESGSNNLYDWQENAKQLKDDENLKEFLEFSLERLKNESTQKEEYRSWQKSMYAKRLDKLSFFGQAYDYIHFHKSTFRHRITRAILH